MKQDDLHAHTPVGGEIAWEPDREPPPALTPEEMEALRLRLEALQKLLDDKKKRAKYKIEIKFSAARSMRRPTPGIVSFWESGTKLHGGGDAKLYICLDKRPGIDDGCGAFIPDAANGSGFHFCVKCGRRWNGEMVTGEYLNNLTMRGWAEAILRYYRRCEHDADIYLKHDPADIRYKAAEAQATSRGIDALNKVRRERAPHIYPLRNIIEDTSAGADLLGRFYAFLTN